VEINIENTLVHTALFNILWRTAKQKEGGESEREYTRRNNKDVECALFNM
jgi:hypothetical protein